ncbi:ABC transporter substrate-binding protein [Microtetraspora sp. NBRC 13810]|uniref:ABC transporter substrate-binding protein n=1 Tax=Microtetraspora sp. NBRC 13810 TaxID=3030990 RepID=UPI0024A30EA2|nr:ABC transporter substrate-binding protein [Microtetraspora sp. NBRC 13810]GLW07083.1 ABC transporter substrate-binding protein [Microtetraspora sp. NBRC 13810]
MKRIRYLSPGLAGFLALVTLAAGFVAGKAVFDSPASSEAAAGPAAVAGTEVDVIVKATDSEFWQSMLAGAKKAGTDLGVKTSLFGPTSEADIEPQVRLVESSIARGAKAIVLAANSSTALNGVIDRARQAGVKVITVDNKVTTASDGFIGTDNVKAGQQAGERMCKLITDAGKADGKVLHESAVSGVQVLIDRFEGFKSGLAKDCPQARITQTLVNDNDLNKAVGQVNDAITSTPDLAGIFADNNTSGTGAAKAVTEKNAGDRLAVVAFDSDPAEVQAVRDGAIDAIVVQNPFFFGYQGVAEAAMAVVGSNPPVNLDPGAVLVDGGNVGAKELQPLLNPPKTKG